mgnify:CR=1 FL=1
MSAYTKNLSEYIKKRGINLSKVARETGISYSALYSSLMDSGRERDLNAGTVMYLHHFSDGFSISEIKVLFILSKELAKANNAVISSSGIF